MPPFQTIASIAAALGHALLDGIWLGILLALILAVTLRAIKGLNAASRHAIWYAALIAIAALPMAGFGWSLAHASAVSAFPQSSQDSSASAAKWAPATGAAPTTRNSVVHSTGPAAARTAIPNHQDDAVTTTPPRLPFNTTEVILAIVAIVGIISVAGFIGVLLSLARLLAVKRDSRPFDAVAESGLRRWSARPSGGRMVSLRVSQGVDVPAAVGFLHPSILVPASWPANLDADELDKIVMHEYSHLRRADDWTAFIQRVAERLFWFNPAVRYIAGRANLEREIACDDRVVAEYANATSYAECLWRIAQFSHMPAAKSLVPAALVTRAQIVERIELLMNTDRDILPRIRPAAIVAIVPIAIALLIVGVVRAPAITLAAAQTPWVAQHHNAVQTTSNPKTSAKPGHSTTIAAMPVSAAPSAVDKAPAASTTGFPTGTINVPVRTMRTAAGKIVALSGSGLDMRSLLQACTGCDLSGKDLRNADLHGLRLSGDDMSNVDLRGANLRGTNFEGVDLTGARLDNADLTNAVFAGADLKHVSWTGAKLDGVELQGVQIDSAMLHTPQVRRLLTSCQGCDMAGLDMRNLDLRGVHLQGADLSRADLRNANLSGATLDGVDLGNALLDGTDLTNASLNGCNLEHVDLRHAHISGLKLQGADLRKMQFSGLNLRGLTADGSDLSGAQLRQLDLSGVQMNGSDFKSADLTGAKLVDGEFAGADFRQARLDGANLQGARLCGYDTYMNDRGDVVKRKMSCADFSGASIQGADFRGVKLCDWHKDVANCRAVSAAELKKYSHSNLSGAILPNF